MNMQSTAQAEAQVGFSAGDRPWWVPAGSVREVHETLLIEPVPRTAPWFLGTALPRGQLVSVTDFGAWLGAPGPVNAYVEFESGVVLGVTDMRGIGDFRHSDCLDPHQLAPQQLDLQRLLSMPTFLDVTGAGGQYTSASV